MNIAEYLQSKHVPFEVLPHRSTHSAESLAKALDVPSRNVAKSVLVKVDGEFILAVVPASQHLSLAALKERLAAERVELASEDELAEVFRDCELGVAPPFGTSYGIRTLVDRTLTEDEHIVFEANSHDQAIYVRYQDYAKIESPQVESFASHQSV